MPSLGVDDFSAFFRLVHGVSPFPWQQRLIENVARDGGWHPVEVIDVPTGAGKTSVIDVALFHLALEAERGPDRRAPVRIAFVVDRRLVVDDAASRAKRIAEALAGAPPDTVVWRVAERLRRLGGTDTPLVVSVLRGGMPRETDWARSPAQPTIVCSTVDQVGSRLLFRGYGVSDGLKPIHAGLLGADCLVVLDEAHMSAAFRDTLAAVERYRGDAWRDPEYGHCSPWGVVQMTATPDESGERPVPKRFGLSGQDVANETLARRLGASKPVRLVTTAGTTSESTEAGDQESIVDTGRLVDTLVTEALASIVALRHAGLEQPAVAVVVNRVARARTVFERLAPRLASDSLTPLLMIGPSRPIDRDQIVAALKPVHTGASLRDGVRSLAAGVVLVATQCIEVGADIDLDGIVTELAPLAALRQRIGRLNRAGRDIVPYAAIVASKSTLRTRYLDPVYGSTLRPTWDYLNQIAERHGTSRAPVVDFGITRLHDVIVHNPPPAAVHLQPRQAPVLMPAHVDLLAQTAPVPNADPDVSLFLHGPDVEPDAVTVVWRADIEAPDFKDLMPDSGRIRHLLHLLPPRAAESIQLPVFAVKRWLLGFRGSAELSDIGMLEPQPETGTETRGRWVFRWLGDDDRSTWIAPHGIRPGDTIVVPAHYGGVDSHGWNPQQRGPIDHPDAPRVRDLGRTAALPYAGRRFVVRVAPGLLGESAGPGVLSDALAESVSEKKWPVLRDRLLSLPLDPELAIDLGLLDAARRRKVDLYYDLYGLDGEGRPKGVVFVARFGLQSEAIARLISAAGDAPDPSQEPSTEDDLAGSILGLPVSLREHTEAVQRMAREFAEHAGLPPARVRDIALAARFHDRGKADSRWQAWLCGSDPLGDEAEDRVLLAKSGRPIPAHEWTAADLPKNWRHEAFSVRLAIHDQTLNVADDPELVIWLVGTHHGFGRPLFPHHDDLDLTLRVVADMDGARIDLPPAPGPQSLCFEWRGRDWATLADIVRARYGVWELARMEAILRLADHRVSAEERDRAATGAMA
jgi:CRISPR-associated endonuclease/helicase Cas3